MCFFESDYGQIWTFFTFCEPGNPDRDTLNHALQAMRDLEGWTGVSQRPNSDLVWTGCNKNDADKEFEQKKRNST